MRPKVVLLKPATKRLKQLVKEFGPAWVVLREKPVACFNWSVGCFVETPDKSHSRWVRPEWVVG